MLLIIILVIFGNYPKEYSNDFTYNNPFNKMSSRKSLTLSKICGNIHWNLKPHRLCNCPGPCLWAPPKGNFQGYICMDKLHLSTSTMEKTKINKLKRIKIWQYWSRIWCSQNEGAQVETWAGHNEEHCCLVFWSYK